MTDNVVERKKMIVMRATEDEVLELRKKAQEYHLSLTRYLILLGLRGRL